VAISFPTSLDNFTNPSSGNTLDSPSHSLQHSDINDAVEALEAKVGIGASPAGSATSGQVLTISAAGTSTWSTPSQGGLVQVVPTSVAVGSGSGSVDANGKVTFSVASSISFNDVFSATYDTYVIRGSYVGSVDSSCDMRLRVSGTDNSASNYERQLMNVNNASTSFTRLTGQSSYTNISGHTTTYNGINILEIHRPFATSPTLAICLGNTEGGSTDTRAINQFMKHTASTSFTGFTLLVASGTITGTISIYGYR